MKAKDGVDDQVNAIFDSIVEEDSTLKKAAVSGKNQPTESLSLSKIPSFPATIEFWGKKLKVKAKVKAKDGVDDEVNAIFDSIVEEDATLKKDAVSGKNQPTESLSLSNPATREFWGKKLKVKAKVTAKDGVDDEVNAIFDSIVEEDATLKKDAVSGKNQPTESLSLSNPATREFWGKKLKVKAKVTAKDGVDDEVNAIFDRIVEEDATLEEDAVSGKNQPTESLSLSNPATREFWGKKLKVKAKVKAKDGVDDEVNAIFDRIVEEDATLEEDAVSGKNQPTESLSLSNPATREFWGKKLKVKAKVTAKDGVDDEVNAIFDRIVEEDATLEEDAVSGKNQPTESLSLSNPATREFWGKKLKVKAKVKAKDGVDDEVNAIFDRIVEEDATLEEDAVSGKNQPTESLSLSNPATREFWGKVLLGKAKMKAKGGVDDEVNAIFDSIVEEDAILKKAVVSGKKRPTESASKTPTEKKAKLISPAGQKTGPSISDNALQVHT